MTYVCVGRSILDKVRSAANEMCMYKNRITRRKRILLTCLIKTKKGE